MEGEGQLLYYIAVLWDLRGVAGGDGELGCLCGKAGTSHLCDGSAHSSGCVVNGYGCRIELLLKTRIP